MFSTRLRQMRTAKNMTQAQLAEALGVSPGTITMWETSKREPNYAKLIQIAHYFDCSTDYLLGETNSNKATETSDMQSNWHTDEVLKQHAIRFLQLDNTGYSHVVTVIEKEYKRCKSKDLLKSLDDISLTLFIR